MLKKLLTRILPLLAALAATPPALAQHTTCELLGDSFALRTPHYRTADLVCGAAPDTADHSIALCAPAAFSALIKPDFDDINIAGWHYSGGKLHKGYPNRNNSGGIIFYEDGRHEVLDKEGYAKAMHTGGIRCAFEQCLVVHRGKVQGKFPRGPEWVAGYRALCSKQGRLFLFETTVPMTLERYLKEIAKLEVDDAVYMEMGQDYNHTWWRNEGGTATIQFPFYRGTNWIVFKQ